MRRTCLAGLASLFLLVSSGQAQIGPLPGVAVIPPSAASGGGCTPAVTNIGVNNNAAGATLTLAGVTVPAGSLIVVITDESGAAAVLGSVSDGVNTYSTATSGNPNGSSNNGVVGVFYAANAGLSSGTITYTKGTSGRQAGMTAVYATNVLSSSPLDGAVTATATGSSAAPTVTSGTPAQSGELFIGAVGTGATANTFTEDSGNGWSVPPNVSSGSFKAAGGNQVNAGTGTKTFAPTFSGSVTWFDAVIGFKHC